MSIGIFIKTCKKDHEWLKYCLLSIEKNTNDFSGLCIVTDIDHDNIVEYKNIITKMPIEIHFVTVPEIEHTCQNGIGYLWMQNIKLLWHKYCDYETVLQIDSDCIINDTLTPNFYKENNKWKWFVRDWSLSELAIVHKNPLTKLLGKESQYEHMPVPGWILDKETTINFHHWIYEQYGCSWWKYLCNQTKEDWGSSIDIGISRGSSVYNAYGGFLENHKTINKYKFIVNNLNNPPPIKQYWSWTDIDPLTKKDIEININKKQEHDFFNLKIDTDFDEDFYKNEYPETKDFFQPYCTNHGIDDKRRLFYHYKMYGNNNYKNLLEKNHKVFIPNISRRKPFNKLAIVTSFFNPCEYTNIVDNYRKFANHIKKHADLFPIELSFNDNFVINDENVIRIKGTKQNMLWQKEALLNIAIAQLPKEYTDVAWLDCDIIFHNEDWVQQLYDALNSHKIVQLFNNAHKLDLKNNKITCPSLVSSFPDGEAGFAWAARREILEEIQLLDNQIFGGADYIMASAFLNKPLMIKNVKTYVNNETTTRWIEKTIRIVDGSVGHIDSTITHLYHGNEYNRNYTRQNNRKNLIESIDISQDVKKHNDIWTISEKHNEQIYKYFLNRQEDDNIHIQHFLNEKFSSYEKCIDFYLEYVCDNIMTTSPDLILQVKQKLLDGISQYAQQHSDVYKQNPIETIFTRNLLNDKNSLVCKNIPKDRIMNQHTSGSTTGEPFNYYNDTKYFDTIQKKSEFDLILKEYDLYNKPLKILNLFKHPYNPKPTDFYLETKNYSNSRFHTYGAAETTTYFVNWDNYIENPDEWHDELLNTLQKLELDIVLGSGPVFNILCNYIKKKNFKKHFAYLLSHTTEFPRIKDFQFLKDNGNITHYCDHMRCYDGGANFFTCKYNTHHLNDNLSWVMQGPDNKLISTDYINIVAPFVNYWNGDLCEIKNQYQLCECGRYYRPFKMLQNRPFALKGPTKLTDIKKQISQLSFKGDLIQVQFENLSVNIYSSRKLKNNEKEILQDILKEYQVFWRDTNAYGLEVLCNTL